MNLVAQILCFKLILTSGALPGSEPEPRAQSAAVARPNADEFKNAFAARPSTYVWALLLVLGAAVLAVVLKTRKTTWDISERPEIRVLATKPLNPKVRLALVEIKGRELLLSVGDRGANLVVDFWVEEEPSSVEQFIPPTLARAPAQYSNSDTVSGLRSLRKQASPTPVAVSRDEEDWAKHLFNAERRKNIA